MEVPSIKPIIRYNDRVLIESTCNAIDNIAELLDSWERENFRFFYKFKDRATERYETKEGIVWNICREQICNKYPEIHIVIEQRKGGK